MRIKFANDPGVIRKMDAAQKMLNQQDGSLKATSAYKTVNIPGLNQLNTINNRYSVNKMKRIFRHGGKFEAKHRAFGLHLWYELTVGNDAEIQKIIADYTKLEYIQCANPKYAAKQVGTLPNNANDPELKNQWHYNASNDNDIDLKEAWEIETGNSNVIVAIEDCGIEVDHEDLIGNMWINPGEIAGNGIDDDNNGFIDDIHGYNFAKDTGTISVVAGHGTHVAGIVGAESNNGIGVAGIAGGSGSDDGVRLMSCQVFEGKEAEGGFAEAMIYAADNGAVISQNSWGHDETGSYDQSILNAIDYFIANAGGKGKEYAMDGGIAIFAAGNSNRNDEQYPAYYDKTLAVCSLGNSNKKPRYSNYGTWVDIAAPGGAINYPSLSGGIYSTTPNNSYFYMEGTSMACPHVSGVAALVVSKNFGNINAYQLRKVLVNNVDSIYEDNQNYRNQLGSGRLNAYKALTAVIPRLPEKATKPTPSDEGNGVRVNTQLRWAGNSLSDSYDVYFGTSNPPALIGNITETTYNPGALDENTTYYWRVDGVNSKATTTGDVWSFSTFDSTEGEYTKLTTSIFFQFDKFPKETSWELFDIYGDSITSGGPYMDAPEYGTKTIKVKLDPACYSLVVKDTYGDGMRSYGEVGYYEVKQGERVLASGGDFTTKETKTFCLNNNSNPSISQTASINVFEESDVKTSFNVYPNPAKDFVKILLRESSEIKYQIRDLSGKLILSNKQKEQKIDLRNLRSGMYCLTVITEKAKYTKLIIKK